MAKDAANGGNKELTGTFENDPDMLPGEVQATASDFAPATDPLIHPDVLADVKSFDQAMAVANSYTEGVQDSSEVLGEGFELVNDKNVLVGTPFVILDWNFYTSKQFGNTVVAVKAMTQDNRKVIFNDGSTGICQQLLTLTERKGKVPVMCRQGLRSSTYETEINGRIGQATTYYLA